MPSQDTINPAANVKSYPVIEKHRFIWVWMGDPARADEALIPPFVGYRDPAWAMGTGRVDYAAPARLIHDNLLDLSHIAYVHANSFGGGNSAATGGWLAAKTDTTGHDRGVTVERRR